MRDASRADGLVSRIDAEFVLNVFSHPYQVKYPYRLAR